MSDARTSRLPPNWDVAPLGDVLEILDSRRIPINSEEREKRPGNVPYYGATGQVGWIDDYIFDEDLILLGEDGAPFLDPLRPKAYVIAGKSWVNNHAHVLRAMPGVSNRFVMYQLNSVDYRDFVSGTTRLKLPQAPMRQIPLRMAPEHEQTRIVAEIEKQFTRLDVAVTALKRIQDNLTHYRTAVRNAACEGRLVPTEAELARREGRSYESASVHIQRVLAKRRVVWETAQLARFQASGRLPKDDNWRKKYKPAIEPAAKSLAAPPEGWSWATVDQLAALEPRSVTDGPFGSNLKTEHYTLAGPRVIRLQNIGDGVFVDEKAHISEEHFKKLKKHQVHAGDIVIAALGERPPRACIVPDYVGPAIVKADCIRFKPAEEVAKAQYLVLSLNAEPTRKRTSDIVHGVGRPRLNLEEIKSIALPVPPIDEQTRIAADAEDRLSLLDKMEVQIDLALKRAERLRQGILKRAFEGGLVPQDPNDDSASVLLQRIRSEVRAKSYRAPAPVKEVQEKNMSPSPSKDLVETLKTSNKPLAPEELFAKAGYERETIDDFYAALKTEVQAGRIQEIRPDNKTVRVQVARQ